MSVLDKIERHVEEPIRLEGYEIVRIQLTGSSKKILQVMIDKIDGQSINLDDCEKVSRLLSILLDQIDAIPDAYNLEVSSPGIDRPLVKPQHYSRFVGHKISLYTHVLLLNKKKNVGLLEKADDHGITIKIEDEKEEAVVSVAYSDIRSAKLKVDF